MGRHDGLGHVAGIMGYDCGGQVGYWAETAGASHIEPLLEYVTHQRAHHAAATMAEPWQRFPIPA
jgi:hypothetical protein